MGIIQDRKQYAKYLDQLKKRVSEGENQKKPDPAAKQKELADPKLIASEKLLELHQKKVNDTGDFSEEELKLVEKKSEKLKKLFE